MTSPLPLALPLAFRLCLSLAWPTPSGGVRPGFACPSEAPGPAPVLPTMPAPAAPRKKGS
jgi:hypothetical protein